MARFNAYRITDYSEFDNFECGLEEMDSFIHSAHGLRMSIENHYCICFGVKDEYDTTVAIFALAFDSVTLDSDSTDDLFSGIMSAIPNISLEYTENFKAKNHHPALEIVYLAVHKDYRGKDIGESVVEGIVNVARNQKIAGCEFITVDAFHNKEYSAVGFYSKCQFYTLDLTPRKDTTRMYRMLYPKETEELD